MFHVEQAIKKFKRHTENGTCPEDLKYRARARITADNDFKTDVKRLRKNAEQEYVKALTRFHYRECDRFRSELQREKRLKVPNKNFSDVRQRLAQNPKQAHSAPTRNNVNKLAESIQNKIYKFSEMMSTLKGIENKQVKQYTCLFSDSVTGKGAKWKQPRNKLKNRRRKECQKKKS